MSAWKERVEIGPHVLYLGDCREILPTLQADAVVTDPPYGIGFDATHAKYKDGIERDEATWDAKPFDPTPILSLNLPSIIWGGNCFASRLPDFAGWLSWVKTARNDADIRQADMELAWTNCIRRSRTFRHLWIGAYRASESGRVNEHPTQKPQALMEWCIGLLPDAATVADLYMGSGTTGVACAKLGRKFIGVEIHEPYFRIACRRIADAVNGGVQPELWT